MSTRGKQLEHPVLAPPLTGAQMRALEYAEAIEALEDAKTAAEKRKEAMVEAAVAERLTSVKVRDAQGLTHTFDIDWKMSLKHTAKYEVERIRADENGPTSPADIPEVTVDPASGEERRWPK